MPVKFTYFDGRGLGEPIRWILFYSGTDWEDVRIPFDEKNFPPTLPADVKSKCRFGQVPLAEFDGKTLVQSLAITRYFAKQAKLVPKDDYEAALCDEYVDTLKDFLSGFYGAYMTANAKEKDEKVKAVFQTSKAKYLDIFESLIKANGGKHLVGNQITWADVVLAYILDYFVQLVNTDLTVGYPNLKNVKDSVVNTPKIKAWLEKRPKTKF